MKLGFPLAQADPRKVASLAQVLTGFLTEINADFDAEGIADGYTGRRLSAFRSSRPPVSPGFSALEHCVGLGGSHGELVRWLRLTVFVTTVALFVRIGRGTLAPWNPPQDLVVVGPHRRYTWRRRDQGTRQPTGADRRSGVREADDQQDSGMRLGLRCKEMVGGSLPWYLTPPHHPVGLRTRSGQQIDRKDELMAKKRSVNKSKLVLEYWNQHPKATAAEVSQALKNQGVSVSVTYIYGIKAKSKKKPGAKQAASQGAAKAASQTAAQPSAAPKIPEKHAEPTGTITLEHIKAVSQSVKAMGGFGRLNELVSLIREVGGLRRFKDLVDAITITEADAVPF